VPGEDPAHAVNEGEQDEAIDDGRDRMANSAHVICNEYVDAVEQGPQDGGSPKALPESPGQEITTPRSAQRPSSYFGTYGFLLQGRPRR